MIAREWKARCPKMHEQGFMQYLYETGVREASETKGFLGFQIFNRDTGSEVEIKLVTYWEDFESIKWL